MFDINHPLNNLGDHWSLINIVDLQKQPWRSLLCCGCPQVHTAMSFSYFVLSFFVACVRTIFSSVYKQINLFCILVWICLYPSHSHSSSSLQIFLFLYLSWRQYKEKKVSSKSGRLLRFVFFNWEQSEVETVKEVDRKWVSPSPVICPNFPLFTKGGRANQTAF